MRVTFDVPHVSSAAWHFAFLAAVWATSTIARGALTVADRPVSRLENRFTSASNRCRISSTVVFIVSSLSSRQDHHVAFPGFKSSQNWLRLPK